MGREHATQGAVMWLGGCEIVQACGGHLHPAVLILGTPVAAGWALAPDLDHPQSTLARSLGPVSRLVATGLGRLGAVVHAYTRTRRDRPDLDGHRTLSHTAVWAVLCGLAVGVAGRVGGPWAAAMLVFAAVHVGLLAALPPRWRRVRVRTGFKAQFGRANLRRVPVPVPPVVAAGCAVAAGQLAPGSVWWLGVAAGCGSLIHCLGDMLTNSGCPVLWPVPIGASGFRRVWYPVGLPRRLRFHTSGDVETVVVRPVLTVLLAVAMGVLVWPWLADAYGWVVGVWHTARETLAG